MSCYGPIRFQPGRIGPPRPQPAESTASSYAGGKRVRQPNPRTATWSSVPAQVILRSSQRCAAGIAPCGLSFGGNPREVHPIPWAQWYPTFCSVRGVGGDRQNRYRPGCHVPPKRFLLEALRVCDPAGCRLEISTGNLLLLSAPRGPILLRSTNKVFYHKGEGYITDQGTDRVGTFPDLFEDGILACTCVRSRISPNGITAPRLSANMVLGKLLDSLPQRSRTCP